MTTAVMTYDSLVSDITTYVDRNDAPFVNQIPRFIMLAENRIASEIRGLGFIKVVTGDMSISNPVVTKPARWRETISFNFGTGALNNLRVFLKLRTYEYCRTYWPDSSLTGTPKFYADYNYDNYLIVPTPSVAYPFELVYHERPLPLSDTNQTNWTTEYAPQLLLYATLLEAVPFLKNYEIQPMWQAMFDRASAAISKEDMANITDKTGRVQA